MKPIQIVLLVVVLIVVAIILYAVMGKKENTKENTRENTKDEFFFRLEDSGDVHYKLKLRVDSLKSLKTITEIRDLSNFENLYFGFFHELISSEISFNSIFKGKVIELMKSVFGSFKHYTTEIMKDNPGVFYSSPLDDEKFTSSIFNPLIDLCIQTLEENYKKKMEMKNMNKNQWHLIDPSSLEKISLNYSSRKALKINLLHKDEELLKETADILCQVFDNRKVIFENLPEEEEGNLMKNQREYMKAGLRFLFIQFHFEELSK